MTTYERPRNTHIYTERQKKKEGGGAYTHTEREGRRENEHTLIKGYKC